MQHCTGFIRQSRNAGFPFGMTAVHAKREPTRTAPLGLLFKVLSHFEVALQVRQRLLGPVFQRGIPAFCIPPKQGHGVLMSADLVLMILLREVGAVQALELVQHFLVRAVKVQWNARVRLSGLNRRLQFVRVF
jgi:hypothetical protein